MILPIPKKEEPMNDNAAIVQEFREKFTEKPYHTNSIVDAVASWEIEEWFLTHLNAKDALIEKARQEGRNEAVDYIDSQIQAFSDLETKKYGPDTTLEEYKKMLNTARSVISNSMTIYEFISRAIEGGWNDDLKNLEWWFDERGILICDNGNGIPAQYGSDPLTKEKILLDPLAWQAVGKIEGWGLVPDMAHAMAYARGKEIPNQRWLWNMHRMIDSLAEGKTIEEFLATL